MGPAAINRAGTVTLSIPACGICKSALLLRYSIDNPRGAIRLIQATVCRRRPNARKRRRHPFIGFGDAEDGIGRNGGIDCRTPMRQNLRPGLGSQSGWWPRCHGH